MKRRVYIRYKTTPMARVPGPLPKVQPKIDVFEVDHWKTRLNGMSRNQRQEFGELLREIKAHAPGVHLEPWITLPDLRDLVYSVTRCQIFRL